MLFRSRKIDFENPQILFAVQCTYVASQLLCLGAYYYVTVTVSPAGRWGGRRGRKLTWRFRRRRGGQCAVLGGAKYAGE